MNILSLFKKPKPIKEVSLETERREVILSGAGGQGIVLAGKILAEAASIYDNKEAIMTISYGPEARGGASKTEVIISLAKIGYPKVINCDVLLAMTQEALDKYGSLLKCDNLLIIDELFINKVPPGLKNVFKAPFTTLAVRIFNTPMVANIIALSSLAAITKIVSRESLIQTVLSRIPEKVLVLDRVAIDMGFKLVEESGFIWGKNK